MSDALERLRALASLLEQDAYALELSVRAMHEACPRGVAFGLTTRGPHAASLGAFRLMVDGEMQSPTLPLLAHLRTPAYDVADVPADQRNRWVEPFREGIATPEGFKASTIYPLVKRFGVLDQGRVAVCSGARQVALVGVAVAEGTTFSDDERARLTDTGAALVVPLRVAAVVADQAREQSALERLLENSGDALLATDDRGAVVVASRRAVELVRADRALAGQIEAAVRRAEGRNVRVVDGGRTLHVSPDVDRTAAYLVAIDGDGFVEPPVALSARQDEVLGLVEKGLGNAEIATAMGLSPATVKTMLERLYRKVGVAGRGELASWARRRR